LSGIDNIHHEADNVAFLNDEFVCSVKNVSPLSEAQERSLDRDGGRKYKI